MFSMRGQLRHPIVLVCWLLAVPAGSQTATAPQTSGGERFPSGEQTRTVCMQVTPPGPEAEPKCVVIECDARGRCWCPGVLPDGRKQPLDAKECPEISRTDSPPPPPPPEKVSRSGTPTRGNAHRPATAEASANRTTDQNEIIRDLGLTREEFRRGIHEIKKDIQGNPDVEFDRKTGDVFDRRSGEHIGNLLDYKGTKPKGNRK